MRIDRIDLFHVAMPLISPWRTAYGEDAVIESVLVKLTSGDLYGWGETSPLAAPCYSPEWAGGVYATLRTWLAPRVVGREVRDAGQLQQMLAIFKGNPFAKAGLDLAWWDLHARRLGQPLYRVLGGADPTVTVGADFGVTDSVAELVRDVGAALAAGFKRVKLKFRPGWDLPMARAVRQAYPDAVLHIDCNSGYRLDDAGLFRELDALHLAMYEQPLGHEDLLDHAELQRRVQTPVCLDESINSLERARQAIALGSCRYLNIKPARVGGLTNALAIHDLMRKAGIPCWVGGMLESAVGVAHCIALATLPNFTYPADIFPSSRFYREDVGEPAIMLSGTSQVLASELPGCGVEPNLDRLERMTVNHAILLPED
jgi:O-succinylbenzoate synthase